MFTWSCFSDGQYLVSGSHDGNVIVWDTSRAPVSPGVEMDPILEPSMMFQAHTDTVNGLRSELTHFFFSSKLS